MSTKDFHFTSANTVIWILKWKTKFNQDFISIPYTELMHQNSKPHFAIGIINLFCSNQKIGPLVKLSHYTKFIDTV